MATETMANGHQVDDAAAPAERAEEVAAPNQSAIPGIHQGASVQVTDTVALAVTAQQDVAMHDSAALAAVAGRDLHFSEGGAAVAVSGLDFTLTNGGTGFISAGRDLTLTNGGAGVILAQKDVTINNRTDSSPLTMVAAGREATVRDAEIGLLLAPKLNIQGDARVRVDLSPQRVVDAAITLAVLPLAVTNLVLGKLRGAGGREG